MAQENVYKKFFLQRQVLDTLRSFIECSDEFLDKIGTSRILSQKEINEIMALRWPMSRNWLMQLIVRKKWQRNSFEKFSNILLDTQKEALTEGFTRLSKEFFRDYIDISPNDETHTDDAKNEGVTRKRSVAKKTAENVDSDMANDTVNEKDAVIQRLIAENDVLKHQLEHADGIVTHTLVEIHHDATHNKLEKGLLDLRDILTRQSVELLAIRKKNAELTTDIKNVRAKMTVLIEENIELKGVNSDLESTYKNHKDAMEDEIKALQSLAEERGTKIEQLEKKRNKTESKHKNLVQQLQLQITKLTEELAAEKSSVDSVRKEREKATSELVRISEGTRKLLQKLNLGNDYDNIKLSVAVEHARNSVYNRLRRASLAPARVAENNEMDECDVRNVKQSMAWKRNRRNSTSILPTPKTISQLIVNNTITEDESDEVNVDDVMKQVEMANQQEITMGFDEDSLTKLSKCTLCSKVFALGSNFYGACLSHPQGATKLNEGSPMEVWSCCKSVDTIRGCLKAYHTPAITY